MRGAYRLTARGRASHAWQCAQCKFLISVVLWKKIDAHQPFAMAQWRRESVCHPGQTSVSPHQSDRSVLQSGYFSGFRCVSPRVVSHTHVRFGHGCVNQPLESPTLPSHSSYALPYLILPFPPFPSLGPLKSS